MKRLLLTIFALVAMAAGVQQVKAQEAYAVYTSSNNTLTFYFDKQRSSHVGETYDLNTGENKPGWDSYVTKVVFDPSFANARPTTTYYWFWSFTELESITGLSYLNTSEVINMKCMFMWCEKLTSLDLSNFNTAKVTDMYGMFMWCEKLTSLDLSNFNTAKVTDMSSMFQGCSSLTSLDLSNFNTENVTLMGNMFNECSSLTSIDLSHFNTSKVKDIGRMFGGCSSLTSLDLRSFNTSEVGFMYDMFENCSNLRTIYVGEGWSTAAVVNSKNMFDSCTSLVGGNGTTFDASHTDKEYARIDKPGQPGYFTAKGPKRGDANLDGVVDIADVVAVLNAMANDSNAPQFNVNGDSAVDIADVVAVLNIMAQQ